MSSISRRDLFASLAQFGPPILGQKVCDVVFPLLPSGPVGWVVSVGLSITAICTYFPILYRLPTSTATIRSFDPLFPVVVDSLGKLRQPSSTLVTTTTLERSSDKNPNEDDGLDKDYARIRNEPNYGTHLYWYNWWPIWVSRCFLIEATQSRRPEEVLTLSTWALSRKCISDIVTTWKQTQRSIANARTIVREIDTDYNDAWGPRILRRPRSLKSIFLPQQTMDTIVHDFKDFWSDETRQWYRERHYPYRRGHLYHGCPGTGKSSLAFALAGHFDLELYVVPINDPDIGQQTLANAFRCLDGPCMVLLEDIDALDTTTIERGSSKASRSGLNNLSALLNRLDGVAAKEDMFIVMTTNHPEALDQALVRPGRIDKMVHFPNAGQSELYSLFMFTYSNMVNAEIANIARQFSTTVPSGEFTVAELQAFLFNYRDTPSDALTHASEWSKQRMKERSSSTFTKYTADDD